MKEKIYFVGSGSTGELRGKQVSNYLKNIGITSNYLDYKKDRIILNSIKNSKVILIKKAIVKDIVVNLKNSKNYVVLDPLDLCKKNSEGEMIDFSESFYDSLSISDLLICTNNHMKKLFNKKIECEVIHHHWDERLKNFKPAKLDFPNFCFIGHIGPNNSNCFFLDDFSEIKQIPAKGLKIESRSEIFKYNCHYNVRDPKSWNFNFKSSVKLTFAAALNSIILTTKDNSIFDLLGEDYPYYTEFDKDGVKRTLKKIKSDFKINGCKSAFKKIRIIKDLTSLDSIHKEYLKILNR